MSQKSKFKLFDWAKEHAPKALDLVGNLTGIKALNRLSDVIENDNPDLLSAEALQQALAMKALDIQELDLIIRDIDSARTREIEMAKTGKSDWLMYVAGCVALGTFVLMVIAVIFIDGVGDNSLFHQLMGIIEGVAMTIFAYYFGTSKSSSDKTKLLNK